MKIGIDARFYGPVGKGLGRYTQEVVDNIIMINEAQGVDSPGVFDFVIFLSPDNFDEFISSSSRVKKVLINIPWYSWSEQLKLPFYIWREHLDLMHFPHFNIPILTPTKFVMTLHDLILTHFPTVRATTKSNFVYYWKNLAYRLVTKTAIRRAQRVITVSEFTERDIIYNFPEASGKITVTYEGVANLKRGRDSLFVAKLDSRETLEKYHLGNNFLLYVGNAYPHKNLEALIRTFSQLRAEMSDLKLVLVGKEDFFYSRIHDYAKSLNLWQKENINSPVVFPGYVPDAQLEIIYQAAKAYIFPSLYEGFGLPPLEAMAKGCPVASSDRASLPEILGDAAVYFNPEDDDDMLAKIKQILNNPDFRNELITRGLNKVKNYSWWECARETFAVYEQSLKDKK
ncbi:MAG: glycosyltransferase family 1 protein [Patescibacteria group bacterium]|jgi:glycosyltransferase involved in cell wall biosynthesis